MEIDPGTRGASSDDVSRRARELLEKSEIEAGTTAAREVMKNHLSLVMKVQEAEPVRNTDLLTVNIKTNKGIVSGVRDEIASLHGRMRSIIQNVAAEIEEHDYRSAEQAMSGIRLGYRDREKAYTLLKADNEFIVSLQSLSIAMQVIQRLNEDISTRLNEIEKSGAPDRTSQRDLLLGNAILVYEATDFLIQYIENFRIGGLGDINRIHNDALADLNAWKVKIQALKRQAEDPNSGADEEIRKATLADAEAQEDAIEKAIKAWDDVMQRNEEGKGAIDSAQSHLPTLKLMRDNAESQVGVLGSIAILQIVQGNIRAFEDTIETWKNIKLQRLTPDRINNLLGIGA
jgi:hypothetical protein